MTDEQRSALIKIAGELVRCEHMPPYFVADWELPKSTPLPCCPGWEKQPEAKKPLAAQRNLFDLDSD